MAWEVSIVSVVQDATEGVARVTFALTDGVTTVEKTERVSDTSRIKQLAIRHVERLEEAAKLKAEIASPTTGKVDLAPPEPTAEQIERGEFSKKLFAYRQMQRAFEWGLESEGDLTKARDEMKAAYRRAFLGLL